MIFNSLEGLEKHGRLNKGDTLFFGKYRYKVEEYYLRSTTRGNDIIFSDYNINRIDFCEKYYGYKAKNGAFPECMLGDYEALYRVAVGIYKEILGGESKTILILNKNNMNFNKDFAIRATDEKMIALINDIPGHRIESRSGRDFRQYDRYNNSFRVRDSQYDGLLITSKWELDELLKNYYKKDGVFIYENNGFTYSKPTLLSVDDFYNQNKVEIEILENQFKADLEEIKKEEARIKKEKEEDAKMERFKERVDSLFEDIKQLLDNSDRADDLLVQITEMYAEGGTKLTSETSVFTAPIFNFLKK